MDTVAKHQMAVARKTLAMSVAGTSIMGGMTYAEAYKHVFKTDLAERLTGLVAEYGDAAGKRFEDGGISWELGRYGHVPAQLLAEITA